MATIAFKRTLASTDWRPVFRASEILGRQRSTPCSLGREIPGRITQNLVRMAGRRNDVEIGPVPRLFPSAESKNTGRTKVSPYTRRRARARVCVCVCVCLHGIPHSFGDHENGEGLGVFGVREEWRLPSGAAPASERAASAGGSGRSRSSRNGSSSSSTGTGHQQRPPRGQPRGEGGACASVGAFSSNGWRLRPA